MIERICVKCIACGFCDSHQELAKVIVKKISFASKAGRGCFALGRYRKAENKKVVINSCHGGFDINEEAMKKLGIDRFDRYDNEFRSNPDLINLIESGFDCNSDYSRLKIVEVPDDIEWYIHEYDGRESIRECSRVWC